MSIKEFKDSEMYDRPMVKTPIAAYIFYIVGLILLAVFVFMLVTAIAYTKTYMQVYGGNTTGSLSNSIQYVVDKSAIYLACACVVIGIAKAISMFAGKGAIRVDGKAFAKGFEEAGITLKADSPITEDDINSIKEMVVYKGDELQRTTDEKITNLQNILLNVTDPEIQKSLNSDLREDVRNDLTQAFASYKISQEKFERITKWSLGRLTDQLPPEEPVAPEYPSVADFAKAEPQDEPEDFAASRYGRRGRHFVK